jgi:hypothetical protein
MNKQTRKFVLHLVLFIVFVYLYKHDNTTILLMSDFILITINIAIAVHDAYSDEI